MIKFTAPLCFLVFIISNVTNAQAPKWNWAEQIIVTGGVGAPNDACLPNESGIDMDESGNIYMTVAAAGDVVVIDSNNIITSSGGYINFLIKTDSSGQLIWVDTIGTERGAMAIDKKNGQLYFAGMFEGAIVVGQDTFTTPNMQDYDVCIVKYDSSGNVLWADRAGTTLQDVVRPHCLSVDPNGNCYVGGEFGNGIITFQNVPLNPTGPNNGFVTRYDSNGNLSWIRQIGGNGCYVNMYSICTDKNGYSYVTGTFRLAPVTIGNYTFSPIAASPSLDNFIAKFDSSGNILWAKQIYQKAGGCAADGIPSLSCSENFLFATGAFKDTIAIGNDILTATSCDMFAVRMDTSGNVITMKQVTGLDDQRGRAITMDTSGNFYVTGNNGYNTSPIFDGTVYNVCSNSLFVVKYDTSGVIQYVKCTDGGFGGVTEGNAIITDPAGNCFLLIALAGTVGFDTISLSTASVWTDLVLAKLNSSLPLDVVNITSKSSIKLFPNPTNGTLSIDLPERLPETQIIIFNSIGQIISNTTYHDTSKITAELMGGSGLYYVEIITGNVLEVRKVVKY